MSSVLGKLDVIRHLISGAAWAMAGAASAGSGRGGGAGRSDETAAVHGLLLLGCAECLGSTQCRINVGGTIGKKSAYRQSARNWRTGPERRPCRKPASRRIPSARWKFPPMPTTASTPPARWRTSRSPGSRCRIYPELIESLAMVKKAAALANRELGRLPPDIAAAIISACDLIIAGEAPRAVRGGHAAGRCRHLHQHECQ